MADKLWPDVSVLATEVKPVADSVDADINVLMEREKDQRYGGFGGVIKNIEKNAPTISYRTAQAIVSIAKKEVPHPPAQAWWYPDNPKVGYIPPERWYVRTGELQAAIKRVRMGKGWHKVIVPSRAAAFVEYGTRLMPAQPFMSTAVKQAQKVMRKEMKGWLKK